MIESNIKLLPFNFKRNVDGKIILTNTCGNYIFLNPFEFEKILSDQIQMGSDLYYRLKNRQFIADKDDLETQLDFTATQLRTRKAYLNDFTSLHMIVVTCRCNFCCVYCHASSSDENVHKQDMSWKVAKKTVDKIFSSPSPVVKIEFQGGEPLLNWPIIQEIVEYAEIINKFAKRKLEFVICTNLTLMDEVKLNYCKEHNIYISTSLDGNKEIQNKYRKTRDEIDGYERFLHSLELARKILGKDACSPLMTVTKENLRQMNHSIDHYIECGFHGVFLRALNPYGYAVTHYDLLGYDVEDFIEGYKKALIYIIELNLKGYYFIEYYAMLILQRILTPFATGFVDLQSPCGNVIGGAIYDYDGNVYASDEGRMLARTGDRRFVLGNVLKDDYNSIFKGEKAQEIVRASCLETLPDCAICAYQMYCGADPVRYYTECGDLYGRRATSSFCEKNKSIIEFIFELLNKNDDGINDVFWSWLTQRPLGEMRNHD